jgi:two-component sensor histidine kinase
MIQQVEDQSSAGSGDRSPRPARVAGAPSPEARALLQEVDHRVKNNLQLIASLIQLQARRTSDDSQRQALKTVLERVNAITTVHRRLFQGDVHRFEVAAFLRDLVGDLAAGAGRDDIEIVLELAPVQIPAASAATFALAANELVVNALKHAFPAPRAGRLTIALAEEGDTCVLTLVDDGVGLGDAPPGFGLSLAQLLCQQLHASLELGVTDAHGGTRAVLRAPLTRPGA